MQIFIKDTYGKTFVYDCNSNNTLGELKKFVYKKTGLPRTWQRFVFGTNYFNKSEQTFEELLIGAEATLHLMLKWHGVGCHCGGEKCLTMLLRSGKRLNGTKKNEIF